MGALLGKLSISPNARRIQGLGTADLTEESVSGTLGIRQHAY